MKYNLLVRRQAKADIRRAAKWYRKQRPGLEKEFVQEVDAVIGRIKTNPEQYQIVHRDIRHAVLKRFPYGAFYRIEGIKIIVIAVVDLRRDEAVWKMRADRTPKVNQDPFRTDIGHE